MAQRRPLLTGGVRRAAERRRDARRLLFEGLEVRSLLAFNVLAEYPTGAGPQDLLLTPIDAGSQPDLVVVDGSSSVSVLLGNADGTFGSPVNSAAGPGAHSVASGDFNGGATDLVTANSSDVSLLLGNGDGTFQAPQTIAPSVPIPADYTGETSLLYTPRSVVTGDLNADGKLDLVVAGQTSFSVYHQYYTCGNYSCGYVGFWQSYTDGYVHVLIGNGSGGFTSTQAHHLGRNRLPAVVAIADIDGDDNADVITANNDDLSVLLGDGSGAVGAPLHSGSGSGLSSLSLGDVDGDGNLDTITNSGGGIAVQKGIGDGRFTSLPSLSVGHPVNSAVIGDVNADGTLDLVAVGATNTFNCTYYGWYYCYYGSYTHTQDATVLIGNGSGNFAQPLTSSLGGGADYGWLPDVAVADLDGDDLPELVAIDYYAGSAIVATNDGDWDPPPSIVISDATVTEGDDGTVNAEFIISIIGDHDVVSVNYATANSTALAGADYIAVPATLLTFSATESSKTITVPVLGDTLDEFDEQFSVFLSGVVGGVITDSQGVGTLHDDDDAPLVTINDVTKNEGNQRQTTSFVFTVSLSEASGKWISVSFATVNGTATTADSDYVATGGTVNFAPGQTTATITVTVRGDKGKETNETFFVNLTGATDGTVSDDDQGVGTITNDDGGKGNGRKNNSSLDALLLSDDSLTKPGKRK